MTRGELGLAVIFDGLQALAPLLEPDAFLDLAAAVTGIPKEVIGEARFDQVLTATMAGLGRLNLPAIMASATELFAIAMQTEQPGEAA